MYIAGTGAGSVKHPKSDLAFYLLSEAQRLLALYTCELVVLWPMQKAPKRRLINTSWIPEVLVPAAQRVIFLFGATIDTSIRQGSSR